MFGSYDHTITAWRCEIAQFEVVSKAHGTFVVTIDDEDWKRVTAHKWYVMKHKSGRIYFARDVRVVGGKKRKRCLLLHRFIMGEPEGQVVDHKNHDYLDLRKSELRVCTLSQNAANAHKHRDGSTGFKGVSFHDNRYWAHIVNDRGTKHHLGGSPCPIEAAKMYDRAAIERFGDFALTNFPREQYTR